MVNLIPKAKNNDSCDANTSSQDKDKFVLCIVSKRPETIEGEEQKPILTPFEQVNITMFKENSDGSSIQGTKTYNNSKISETVMVSEIWGLMDKYRPKLVTYGGRSFIIPRMRLISMRDNLKCNWLNHAGDKWQNFSTRYNATYHADMMDILSEFTGGNMLMSIDEAFNFLLKDENKDIDPSHKLYQVYQKWISYTN